MQNLLRIGQVCKLYGISLDTLRYYDHKDLLKPIVDKENGYRYYSFEHLDVLEMLLVGKFLEIPLEQMKERIACESIDGYLTMLEEQRRLIEERRNLLEKLSLYTEEMTSLLKNISAFENDYTFSKVTTEKNPDITIYNMKLKTMFNNEYTSQINGIEAFEQWITYFVNKDGGLAEDSQTVGLSILSPLISDNALRDYLDCLSQEGKVSKHCLSGEYKHISFWGKEDDLREYLSLICSHFNLSHNIINVKFRFALLHKDMKHEYFAEIYFS